MKPQVKPDDVEVLKKWAQFRRGYVPRRRLQRDWNAVLRLIHAAQPCLDEEAEKLNNLFDDWSRRFGGLQDPLLTDLGVHRWLGRETSYSDWLAWVLERLPTRSVLDVLGVQPPFDPNSAGRVAVYREYPLDGRFIDLLVHFDAQPQYAIGVEIKTWDEQYEKQSDYFRSLQARYADPACVLIALREDLGKDVFGFSPRSWSKVAFVLREQIAEYVQGSATRNIIVAAMMLGFVAAVEQNLLELPAGPPSKLTLFSGRLTRYLRGEL
jgi:hypothetical protein